MTSPTGSVRPLESRPEDRSTSTVVVNHNVAALVKADVNTPRIPACLIHRAGHLGRIVLSGREHLDFNAAKEMIMRAYMYLGESHWDEGSGLPGDAEMTGQRRQRGVVIAERIGGPPDRSHRQHCPRRRDRMLLR
jgi:hypothetical protein